MTAMQRCAVHQADLVLDGRGWRFASLHAAVTMHCALASDKGPAGRTGSRRCDGATLRHSIQIDHGTRRAPSGW
jgi:hypothetical protein